MDTIMVSVDNLEKGMKQRYKSLVVFIDSNSLPKDVSEQSITVNYNKVPHTHIF